MPTRRPFQSELGAFRILYSISNSLAPLLYSLTAMGYTAYQNIGDSLSLFVQLIYDTYASLKVSSSACTTLDDLFKQIFPPAPNQSSSATGPCSI